MARITIADLDGTRGERACSDYRNVFRDLFPDGVEVSVPMAVRFADQFDWDWAAENLLSATAYAEYEKANAAAYAEYQKVTAPAYAEYDKVSAPAYAEYEKVRAPAYAEYWKVRAPAYAEYWKVRAAAYAEYWKVRAAAWARGWISDHAQISA